MKELQRTERRDLDILVPLQFLRWIAASLVVMTHLIERLVKRGAFSNSLPTWTSHFGEIGVDTFFVISGFIMFYTTARQFGMPGAGRAFLERRIIRVVPIYYLFTAFMLMFQYASNGMSTNGEYAAPSFLDGIASVFFIPYVNGLGLLQPVYGLGWTLEYEIFFYTIFATALVLPRRFGITAISILLTDLFVAESFIPSPPEKYGVSVISYYLTRPVLIYFVIGIFLAVARQRQKVNMFIPNWALCLSGMTLLAIAIFLGSFWVAICVTAAVGMAALFSRPESPRSAFSRVANTFGDSSYSLYLTHSFLLGAIALLTARFAGKGPAATACVAAAAVVFCTIGAWPIWRFLEVPLTRGLRRRILGAGSNSVSPTP